MKYRLMIILSRVMSQTRNSAYRMCDSINMNIAGFEQILASMGKHDLILCDTEINFISKPLRFPVPFEEATRKLESLEQLLTDVTTTKPQRCLVILEESNANTSSTNKTPLTAYVICGDPLKWWKASQGRFSRLSLFVQCLAQSIDICLHLTSMEFRGIEVH